MLAVDRGWWLAVEYGVVTKQSRFEKKLEKLRGLGSMKELLEPGGRIVYRNIFREDQVRDAWTLLAELTPWKSQLHWFLKGDEVSFKDVQQILWCAGFLKAERPCRGIVAEGKEKDRRTSAWLVGCDRRVSVAPTGFEDVADDKRHILSFAKVDEKGLLRFDRPAIAAFLAEGTLNGRCPLSPARDPAKLAETFQDVSVRVFGWPVVLEMGPELKKKLGAANLEAEHGFVLKKGVKDLEEYEPIELRATKAGVEVRRARDLKAGAIDRQVRVGKKVEAVLEAGARLRGVRIEEGYVKMAELGGRYEVEQRFVLATRFHLGLADDPTHYEGYEVGTVPRGTPEYEKWARNVLESVPLMGTWGEGLLDGDGPLDCLGELTDGVLQDVLAAGVAAPDPRTAARLGAGVGVLLSLQAYSFERDGERIQAAVARQLPAATDLPRRAREVLEAVARGEGLALAERPGTRSGPLLQALGGYVDGVREASLSEHVAAREYMHEVGERCAAMLDEELPAASDLYEIDVLGALGVLLVTGPWHLTRARIESWRAAVRRADASTTGDDREFFDRYMRNVELAFELALARGQP